MSVNFVLLSATVVCAVCGLSVSVYVCLCVCVLYTITFVHVLFLYKVSITLKFIVYIVCHMFAYVHAFKADEY